MRHETVSMSGCDVSSLTSPSLSGNQVIETPGPGPQLRGWPQCPLLAEP